MSGIRVESFGPVRPWVRPGETVAVEAILQAHAPLAADVSVVLLDLDRELITVGATVTVGPGASVHRFDVVLPDAPRHGYGLRLRAAAAGSVAVATAAVEALAGWWEAPRHAAITDYEDATAAATATRDLAAWQVNVVQHYDWMWRHYRYRPPDGATEFVETLGRKVSHDAVRASIDAGHEVGIASLAYGSVYGAETEYVEEHPDERVFDEAGEPLSLDGVFHINDLRPGTSWPKRLLGEYVDAIKHFEFDGIHMDSYGPPHAAVAADGKAIDFAALYPRLIEEAAALAAQTRQGARVLFNCVEGFPLEAVAPAPAAALYLELWPPDRSFGDVVRWIDRARGLAEGRQVVIAAYAAALKDEDAVADRAAAFEATPLLGCFIAAAGAYHHTLAESDRLLVEGYYPAAVRMSPAEADELRALWRFTARYAHLLSDPGLLVAEPVGLDIRDPAGRPVPWATEPEAGRTWARLTRLGDEGRVLHLLDLRGQSDAWWDAPRQPPSDAERLRLTWAGAGSAVAASPWTHDGDALPLTGADAWGLPAFRRWLMVVVRCIPTRQPRSL